VVTTPIAGEPDGAALAETRLAPSSCAALKAATRRTADARIREMRRAIDAEFARWAEEQPYCGAKPKRGHGLEDEIVDLTSSGGNRSGTAPRLAQSASGTNNQVANVDEADIVKNDGRYVYVVMNGALRILEALEPKVVSVTRLHGDVKELFVEGDRAVVYASEGGSGRPACTYGYDCAFLGDGSSTRILVLDMANRAAPRLVRSIELSGSLIAARRSGHAVHTVVSEGDTESPAYETWPADLRRCGVKKASVKQRLAELARKNAAKLRALSWSPTLRDGGSERQLCERALSARIDDGDVYTTLVSFDLTDDTAPAVSVTLRSRPGAVFASATALYVATTHERAPRSSGYRGLGWYSFYPSVNEVSDVHKFRIGAQPSDTHYVGTGVVPGHVLGQFAMDEYYGYLRVATTRGRVPDPKVSSAVSMLAERPEGNLVRVGAVENIAPGEDIRAVRFDDDRGYVVTFKKTDPLLVLDLYRPDQPRLLGTLEIPGFSTYLHRLDRNHLLSIGFDADDHDQFAYFDGLLLQLFDVSAPTDPKLLFREKIGTRGSSSEAAADHLAFNYFGEKGLLAVPLTVCEGGGDGFAGSSVSFSGLMVYRVSVDQGFARLGGVDHGSKNASCSSWWTNASSAVRRSLFLDDFVYSIARDRVKVQRLDALGKDVADIALTP
jgi:hypothetical protein